MKTNSIVKFSIIILICIAAYFILPWVAIFAGVSLSPNPQKPEILYAEFPFKLVFEMNGEQRTVEDTLICEYDGIGMNEGVGKYRKWKRRLQSGNEVIVLFETENILEQTTYGVIVSRSIIFSLGTPNYYMGENEKFEYTFPDASCREIYRAGEIRSRRVSADELFEKYGIRLISWEILPPIDNHFK